MESKFVSKLKFWTVAIMAFAGLSLGIYSARQGATEVQAYEIPASDINPDTWVDPQGWTTFFDHLLVVELKATTGGGGGVPSLPYNRAGITVYTTKSSTVGPGHKGAALAVKRYAESLPGKPTVLSFVGIQVARRLVQTPTGPDEELPDRDLEEQVE